MTNSKSIFISLLLCFYAQCAFSAIVTFDSDASTSAILNSVGSSKITSGVAGGLAGSLGGQPDDQFTNNTLLTIDSFTAGGSNPIFNISVYFQFATPATSSGGAMISVGLAATESTDAFSGSRSMFMAGINKASFANTYGRYTANYRAGSGGSSLAGTSGINLVNGNWYQISLDAVWNNTTGHYAFQFKIYNSDPQGALGSTIYTDTFTDTLSATDYTDGVHPFVAFSGPSRQMGVAIVDNFSSPVPEPSTLWLCGAGIFVVILCRTRRCS